MKIIQPLKKRAASLKHELTALHYAYRHPDTGRLPKILIAVTLAYALSPIDLIPDFIPVLGYLDDIIIIPLLITASIKSIPPRVLEECRSEADINPISLKKNWKSATVIIIFWIVILFAIVQSFL
ncbi:MAG: DUF1232 domain-containing protein [Spirochaetes bacterium]|nr:DUF1232 domain-containing protein [Spirochaetota bacterium]